MRSTRTGTPPSDAGRLRLKPRSRSDSPMAFSRMNKDCGPWMPKMNVSGLMSAISASQSALAELPRQPVAAPRGVAELLLAEPDEDALGGDPAVLVKLHVVPDLAGLEPGQVVQPSRGDELQGLPAPHQHLAQRRPVAEVRRPDMHLGLLRPASVLHREQDLREPAVPALGVGLVLRCPRRAEQHWHPREERPGVVVQHRLVCLALPRCRTCHRAPPLALVIPG